MLYSQIPQEKIFFLSKFFDQSELDKKIKCNYSAFSALESRDQWTLMLKKFYWPFLYCRNPREKIYFLLKFFDQSEFEKNEFQLFQFFTIRIDRPVNTDAEKILLTFLVFSKSARKNFFLLKFFDQSEFEKNEFQLFQFFPIRIDSPVNTDAEKILLTYVVFSNSAGKNFLFIKIFRPIRIGEKMKFNYSIFFSSESKDEWTPMLNKLLGPLFYFPNRWEKLFILSKFLVQSAFEKKSKLIIPLFLHWNRQSSQHWCWKNSINLCCILKFREKKIFFLSKFFDQSELEKKSNAIIPLFLHWNRETNEHWCWKTSIALCGTVEIRAKNFVFIKISEPIRFPEKMKFN